MNEVKHSRHGNGDQDSDTAHHGHRPYWKRAHRDWRVWVAVCLMLAGMVIYIMTNDLAGWPRNRPQQPHSGAVGK